MHEDETSSPNSHFRELMISIQSQDGPNDLHKQRADQQRIPVRNSATPHVWCCYRHTQSFHWQQDNSQRITRTARGASALSLAEWSCRLLSVHFSHYSKTGMRHYLAAYRSLLAAASGNSLSGWNLVPWCTCTHACTLITSKKSGIVCCQCCHLLK